MAINLDSEETKHIITGYEHWGNYGNGRGGLHAYTLCGWLYLPDRMEGGHAVGDWWTNPAIRNVCEHCRHAVACRTEDAAGCEGCQAAEEDAKLGERFGWEAPEIPLRNTNSRECYSEAVAAGSSEDRAPPFEGGGRRFESSPAVSPTHVGMDRRSRTTNCTAHREPHARGDGPTPSAQKS